MACCLASLGQAGATTLNSSLRWWASKVTRPGPGAVLAGGVFAVSKLVWRWSLVAEVFSLNNLFVGLLFCLLACFHNAETVTHKQKFGLRGALCCGLSLCNQHTLVIYVLVIITWALLQLYTYRALSFSTLLSLGFWFLTGFLPYLYLPISSYLNTAGWTWGDQTTFTGLLTHLLRIEYGTFSLAKSARTNNLVQMLQRCCAFVCLLAVMVSLYSVFFAWRANLDIENPLFLGVVERFWLQADAGVCVLAGVGLNWTLTWLERWRGLGTVWTSGAWLLTAALLSHMIQLNSRECDQSRNEVVERFARELIFSFPEKSLVLTRGDLPGNTLRYLHYCQALRPDLSLVDQEMMTYSWYIPKLQQHLHGVTFPGLVWDPVDIQKKNSFNIEQFLQHNMGRPVFACIGLSEGDRSWERTFSRWPYGVCEQLMPITSRLHPVDWLERTQHLYNWSQPHDSFPPGSWERVANEEMWQARMKMAFFLFDLAERMEGGSQAHLYELSYNDFTVFIYGGCLGKIRKRKLYCQIVDDQADYPTNWDKNLALAAERLLRSGGGSHEPESLLSRSIQHFTRYLTKEPTDPQSEAIRSTITHLRKERDRLRHL